jgi:predicted RNA-binding Zn ribbon-like protein
MDKIRTHAETLKLIGGRISLDFANTVGWHASDHPHERLTSYSNLVAWSQHAGILTDREAQCLLNEAARRPVDANAVLERAIALREAIYRTFSAISHGRPPEAGDLARFNAELSDALTRSQIVPTADGFAWDWVGAEDALDRVLWTVVRDAVDLLTSDDLNRVQECAGDGCGWLFLDMSRNRSRRWCAMGDCGNRAKARRYYERRRAARRRVS